MTDLADLSVPGPTVIPLTAPFWAGAAEGRLMIQHCVVCVRGIFYPREICPHCWSNRLEWKQASGLACLRTFSTIHKPGHPGWAAAAPYVVGLVGLDEGPTMLSHILTGGRKPRVNARLALAPRDIGGRILPAFAIIEEGTST